MTPLFRQTDFGYAYFDPLPTKQILIVSSDNSLLVYFQKIPHSDSVKYSVVCVHMLPGFINKMQFEVHIISYNHKKLNID